MAHAGEVIRDHSKPSHTREVIVPGNWIIAIHGIEESHAIRPSQDLLNFGGAIKRFANRPHGGDACMYQGHTMLVVHQRLVMKPFDQCLSVWRIENVIEII